MSQEPPDGVHGPERPAAAQPPPPPAPVPAHLAYGQAPYPPPPDPPPPYPPPAYPPPWYPPPAYVRPGYGGPPVVYGPPVYTPPSQYVPAYGYLEPDDSPAGTAGAMWILCILRDVIVLIGATAWALFVPALGPAGFLLAIFPIIGIAGSAIAMTADFTRKKHKRGTIGGVMAVVGTSCPGVLIWFGPVGLMVSLIALALHMASKRYFTSL